MPHRAGGKFRNAVRHRRSSEDDISAVGELEQTVQRAIAAKQTGPVALREMLLQLLGFRVAQLRSAATNATNLPTP